MLLFNRIIRICLSLWSRSARAYHELRESGMLLLPSGRQLQNYKNCVKQTPGFNRDMLHWMLMEAQKLEPPVHGYEGGVIFDEMSIQVNQR